VAALTVVDA